jgi:N-acetylneuraminic acid mutarotase
MPWDGGVKVWRDDVFALNDPDGTWELVGRLPRPLAYGVSVSTPDAVYCIGGADAARHYQDTFMLRVSSGCVYTKTVAPLPAPLAYGCGAVAGKTVYVAGGTGTPEATSANQNFWALDLSAPLRRWRHLPPWPGSGRMLSVAGAMDGSFYLFGGVELSADADGKPARRYLTDAYRYKPGSGWKQLADMPRGATAAPSPAIPIGKDQLLIVSGDDGKLANFQPKSEHPGFLRDMLVYNIRTDTWTTLGESPLSRATAPAVIWEGRAAILNGEVRPGVRTPEVWALPLP